MKIVYNNWHYTKFWYTYIHIYIYNHDNISMIDYHCELLFIVYPDSKVRGANMGPTPCWPHEPCYQGRNRWGSLNSMAYWSYLFVQMWYWAATLIGKIPRSLYRLQSHEWSPAFCNGIHAKTGKTGLLFGKPFAKTDCISKRWTWFGDKGLICETVLSSAYMDMEVVGRSNV